MIGRVLSAVAAPAAAVALAKTPVIWSFLGIPYEAPSMVSGLFSCIVTRWWLSVAQSARKQHRWAIDVPVSIMALATTAGTIVKLNPDILTALLIGAGFGMVGEGIFKIAENKMRALGIIPSDDSAIKSAMRKIDKLPPSDGGNK